MLEQLMQTAVQYIDTAMVGSLGTSATAAVGSTVTVNWLVNSTVSALGVGFLTFIARALGAGDEKKAKSIASQAVLSTAAVGVFFTVLTLSLSPIIPSIMRVDPSIRKLSSLYFFIIYLPMLPRSATMIFSTILRASGDSKTPMYTGLWVNIINVVLNFFLIFPSRRLWGVFIPGADLGVIGAAIASAISFTAGGIIITVKLFTHKKISPLKESFTPDFKILTPCLKVAFPNMIQRFTTSLGYVAFASMVNSLGEVATAAHTIANTVESAFYIPGYGMQTAAATLAGNALGSGDYKKLKETGNVINAVEVILMIISGALLFIFAPYMVMLFSAEPEVIRLGSTVLRMVALSEPFYGVSIIVEGIMQGVGETRTPLVFNIFGMWCIRIAGTFLATQVFSGTLISAWGCMITHNMLLFVLFVIYYKKVHGVHSTKGLDKMQNIIHITEFSDPRLDVYARLTEAQLLNREFPSEGLFIAESPKVIERALDAGYTPVSVLVETGCIKGESEQVLSRCGDIPIFTAPMEVLKELTGYLLTRGLLCAMRRPLLKSVDETIANASRIAILEDVMNPTNVGAIFRSAAALGMDAVLLTPGCSNPLYRRSARVSMGTVFQIPWTFLPSWDENARNHLSSLGFKTVALAFN
ncbi:MAG: MATE family efflux transporter, partial [Clostridia bacterium]|nr:MATE family efflux transporter [Clostridia bacterium]